jgi:hypothetical protein
MRRLAVDHNHAGLDISGQLFTPYFFEGVFR